MGTLPEHDLADPNSRFAEINGLSVHYKEMGQGEPVFILLHGFGASEFSWQEVVEPLSKHGRVIVYDRPVFGLTERPMPAECSETNPYSTQGNIELLDGLTDELGVKKAILVGNSAGGEFATVYALEHPDKIQGLVLVDPAVGSERGVRIPSWILPLLKTPQLRTLGPLLVRSIAGDTGDKTLRLAWHDPSLIDQQVYDGYSKPLMANNWDKALYEFAIAENPVNYADRLTIYSFRCLSLLATMIASFPPNRVSNSQRKFPVRSWLCSRDAGMSLMRNAPINSWILYRAFWKKWINNRNLHVPRTETSKEKRKTGPVDDHEWSRNLGIVVIRGNNILNLFTPGFF